MSHPTKPERVTGQLTMETASTPLVIERQFIATLVGIKPNLKNIRYTYSHATPTTVTNFLHGQDGQEIVILGNGNTTIDVTGNIVTNTGIAKVLDAYKTYEFTFFGAKWYEGA